MVYFGMAIAYLLLPVGCSVCVLLRYFTTDDKNEMLLCSAFLAVAFGIAGFCFKNPATDPDLVRYLQMMSTYEGKGLFESFNTVYSQLYTIDILFWVIANYGTPQLLPAVASFVYYFISLYIVGDYKIISGVNTSYFCLYVFFVIASTNLGSIINGIRWPMAYAMFLLAVYRDLFKNNRNWFTWFMYITSFFMHFSMLGLMLIRLIMLMKDKKKVIAISIPVVILPQIISLANERLKGIATSFGPINTILDFINRADTYFSWQTGGWADVVAKSTYYKIEKYFYILLCAMFLYLILRYYLDPMTKCIGFDNINPMYIFWFTYLILTMITFSVTSHVYIRFITPAIPFMCIMFFDRFKETGKTCNNYEFSIFDLPLVMFFVGSIAFGAYMNYYFIGNMLDVNKYFSDILLFSFLLPS